MDDQAKTKAELIEEVTLLRQQLAKSQAALAERDQADVTVVQEINLLRTWIDHLPDLVYFKDVQGRYLSGNRVAIASAGISSPEELTGKTDEVFHPADVAAKFIEQDQRIMQSGEPLINLEEKVGSRWQLTTKVPLRDRQGEIIGIAGISRDITERKRIEAEAEQRLKNLTLLVEASAAIGTTLNVAETLRFIMERLTTAWDSETCTISIWNRATNAVETYLDYMIAENGGGHFIESIEQFNLANYPDTSRALEQGIPLQVRLSDPHGDAAEVALLKHLELGATLQVPLMVREQAIGLLELGTKNERVYTSAEVSLCQALANQMAAMMENGRLIEAEQNYTMKLEEQVAGRTAELVTVNAQLQRQINERKHAEEALQQQFAQLQAIYQMTDMVSRAKDVAEIYEMALDGLGQALNIERASILMFDPDGVIRFKASRGLSEDYQQVAEGHSPWSPDDADAQPIVVPDVKQASDLHDLQDRILAEGIRALAFIPLTYQGKLLGKFMLYYGVPHTCSEEEIRLAQTIASYVAFSTERKRAEATLRENEERFRQLTENIQEVFWIVEPESQKILYVSPAYETIWQRSCASVYEDPHSFIQAIHPDDYERVMAAHIARYENDYQVETTSLEYRVLQPNGNIRWIWDQVFPIRDEQGKVYRIAGIAVDITDRKETEKTLQHYTARLEALHQIDQAILAAHSSENIAQAALTHIQHLFSVFRASVVVSDQEQKQGRVLAVMVDGQTRFGKNAVFTWADKTLTMLKRKQNYRVEDISTQLNAPINQILFQDGVRSYLIVPLSVKDKFIGSLNLAWDCSPIPELDMMVVQEVGTLLAIAIEQARLYEQTQRDAATKAVLLNEVNHRVKNNLSSIIGLIYTEQQNPDADEASPLVQAKLQNLINRVQSLAAVHDQLSAANWNPLNLSDLTEQIVHSILIALPRDKQIAINIEPAPVKISPQQANNLALVINELTINSMKYALTERNSGAVHVKITSQMDQISFEFSDDGPGYPEAVLQREQQNIGLYLIKHIVVEDLRGTVSFQNRGGALTTIQFPTASQIGAG